MTSYILLLELGEITLIEIGRLGRVSFPAGYYAYVGSAIRSPDSRLMRHIRRIKKKRWHIDYLREKAEMIAINLSPMEECALNESLQRVSGYELIAPRFGSSDCECASHLAYFREEPDLSTLGIST